MFARTVMMQTQPGTADETIAIYTDSVLPAAKQQKGFKGAFLLTDRATGKGMSITLWASEADLKAGEAAGYYQQQIAKFGPVLAAPPVREIFEVSAQA